MEKKILENKNLKMIFSKYLNIEQSALFLFTKGWSQRAGIIPYTIENGKYYILLGKQNYDGKFSDFGGGCKKKETPLTCAYREFDEETRKSFDINLENITHVIVTGTKTPHQVILLVKMPNKGNEEEKFIKSLSNLELNKKKDFTEVELIKWIAFDDFKQHKIRYLSDSLRSLFHLLSF